MRVVECRLQIDESLGGKLFELELGKEGGRDGGGDGQSECMIACLLVVDFKLLIFRLSR